MPAVEVVKLTRGQDTPELNAAIRSFREPTDEGRAQALLQWCDENVVGAYIIKGQTVKFIFKTTGFRKEIVK